MWLDDVYQFLRKSSEAVRYDSSRFQAYLGLVTFLAKAGATRGRDEMLVQARELAGEIKVDEERGRAMGLIAQAQGDLYFRKGSIGGVQTAQSMAEGIGDPFSRTMSVAYIARLYAQMHHYEQAKATITSTNQMVALIPDEAKRSEAVGEVVRGIADIGRITHRLDLVLIAANLSEKVPGTYNRVATFAKIGECFAGFGEPARTKEFLQKSLVSTEAQLDPQTLVKALALLAISQARASRAQDPSKPPSVAMETLRHAEEIGSGITDGYFRTLTHRHLSLAALEMGEFTEALRFAGQALGEATEVVDQYNRCRAYADVAVPLMRVGEGHKARILTDLSTAIMGELADEFYRSLALRNIGEQLAELVPDRTSATTFCDRLQNLLEATRKRGADTHEPNKALKEARAEIAGGNFERAVDLGLKSNQLLEDITGIRTIIPRAPEGDTAGEAIAQAGMEKQQKVEVKAHFQFCPFCKKDLRALDKMPAICPFCHEKLQR